MRQPESRFGTAVAVEDDLTKLGAVLHLDAICIQQIPRDLSIDKQTGIAICYMQTAYIL
jgi:hypothetical protein